jgi:hypothetical protein
VRGAARKHKPHADNRHHQSKCGRFGRQTSADCEEHPKAQTVPVRRGQTVAGFKFSAGITLVWETHLENTSTLLYSVDRYRCLDSVELWVSPSGPLSCGVLILFEPLQALGPQVIPMINNRYPQCGKRWISNQLANIVVFSWQSPMFQLANWNACLRSKIHYQL